MVDSSSHDIGQKIKSFRNRIGISQHDFEYNIGISTGSLTKIESGKVIPSRETLLRIIDTLKLNAFDTFNILGISPNKISQIIELSNEINLLDDIQTVCKISANEVPKIFGLLGAAVNLVFGDQLRTAAITQSWYTELISSILPFYYKDFMIPMDDTNNLMVQSLLKNKVINGNYVYEFTTPHMSRNTADLVQNIANVESIVCIPMIIRSKLLGVTIYVKNKKESFDNELQLLETFTKSFATTIYNLSRKQI